MTATLSSVTGPDVMYRSEALVAPASIPRSDTLLCVVFLMLSNKIVCHEILPFFAMLFNLVNMPYIKMCDHLLEVNMLCMQMFLRLCINICTHNL